MKTTIQYVRAILLIVILVALLVGIGFFLGIKEHRTAFQILFIFWTGFNARWLFEDLKRQESKDNTNLIENS